MFVHNSDQEFVSEMSKWLRKPLINYYLLVDVTIAIVAIIAAIMTQIWWLLLIPLIAFAEGAGLYISSIFAKVLKDKDTEIERLRHELEVA